jgi:hypothetical protein
VLQIHQDISDMKAYGSMQGNSCDNCTVIPLAAEGVEKAVAKIKKHSIS